MISGAALTGCAGTSQKPTTPAPGDTSAGPDIEPEDAVVDGVTGLLIPQAGLEQGLAEAIKRLLGDKSLAARMGAAVMFACEVRRPGGVFVAKGLAGGADKELVAELKRNSETVKQARPPASRKDSSEWYVIATAFKGRKPGAATPVEPTKETEDEDD